MKRVFSALASLPALVVVLFALSAVPVPAQDVLTIQSTSANAQALQNGNTELTFVAVVGLGVVPITFNYHWERSDGAKTALRVVKVTRAGEQAYRLTEEWIVRGTPQLDGLWEKLFVNSGNTHVASTEIHVGSSEVAVAPAAEVPAAPVAGAHPAYLHALSDLRMARALLQGWANPLIALQMQQATRETEGAISDIVAAAITDGKNIDDYPPIDVAWDNRGRLVRAHELLNNAYRDIDERETNPADRALRSTALGHISRARQALNEARTIMKWL